MDSPRRGSHKSAPGTARGSLQRIRPSPERAQHRQPLVAPFQGLFFAGIPIPRALPWADLFGPFGANSKTAQHQNGRNGYSEAPLSRQFALGSLQFVLERNVLGRVKAALEDVEQRPTIVA